MGITTQRLLYKSPKFLNYRQTKTTLLSENNTPTI